MSERPTDAAELDEAPEPGAANAGLAQVAGDTSLTRRSFAELAGNQRASTREYLEQGEADDD